MCWTFLIFEALIIMSYVSYFFLSLKYIHILIIMSKSSRLMKKTTKSNIPDPSWDWHWYLDPAPEKNIGSTRKNGLDVIKSKRIWIWRKKWYSDHYTFTVFFLNLKRRLWNKLFLLSTYFFLSLVSLSLLVNTSLL